ncbi:MAG: VOC family protein, partial [Mycobacterium sp.]|nr:VOC family protein [Mycobacterium sp.]
MTQQPPAGSTGWPDELGSIGAIRFARRSAYFEPTVHFYRDLIGLPLYATFGNSYGSNGAIFGLPGSTLTFEIVEAIEPVAVDPHDQLCLYFPDAMAQQQA